MNLRSKLENKRVKEKMGAMSRYTFSLHGMANESGNLPGGKEQYIAGIFRKKDAIKANVALNQR